MGEESIYDTVYGIKAPVASMTDYGTQSGFSEIPSLVTVAASDNSFNNISSFILGKISDKTEENIIQYTDTNTAYKTTAGKNFAQYFSGAELEYVPIPNVGNMADYGARDKDFLKGKVAVIARGEITFVEKINNAAAFGAAAVIVYESDPDETSGVLMNIDGASIPAIFVSFKSGQKLLFAASGKESPDEKNIISIPEPDPSQISLADFTSTGAGGTLTIAPDFVTEGNFVQAAARNDKIVTVGGGTQYSAVKAAGIYACVKGYLLDTGYTNAGKSDLCELILKLISSSASPVLDEDGTEISPKTQGAGLADVYAATRAEAVIYNTATKASKSELGENKNILKNINRDAEFATLSITVENITNRKISYDLSMSVMTDKAETFDRDELFAVDNVFLEMTGWDADELFGFDPAEPLPYFITGNSEEIPDALAAAGDFNRHLNRASEDFTPMQITLLPGEKRNINITISLSSDTLKKYSAIFENGFFIEGYVFLTPTDGNGTVISHPYMGFCGDWTKSPILSEKRYDSPAAYYGNNVLTANVYNDYFSDPVVLGQNYLVSVDRDMGRTNERLAAISPNLTYTGALSGYPGGLCWIVTPLRDITSHTVTIKSKDTDTVIFKEERGKISKGVLEEHGQIIPHIERLWTCAAEDNSLYLYPDGRYVCEITVYSRLDSEKFSTFSQTVSFEFSIDTTAPELINAEFTEEGGSHYLNVTASDENFIQIIYVTDGYNSYICDDSIFKPAAIVENGQGNEVTLQFDVSEFFDSVSDSEGAYLYIEVVDFAFNSVVHRIFIN